MPHLLLTGGHGAIGSAIATLFKSKGYDVTAPDSRELDLSNESFIEKFLKALSQPVHTLIYAAGLNVPNPLESQTLEALDRMMAINCRSFFQIAQKIVSSMKEQRSGSILALSSLYGTFARKSRLPYVSSKHALNGMTKTMALEWGPFNIKVNSLSPGFVDTPMTRKNNTPELLRSFEERIPLGRLASPAEIAHVAYFLCSAENSYLTGQDIVVDGGYSAGGFQP